MKIVPEHIILSKSRPYIVRTFTDVRLHYPYHIHSEAFELTYTFGRTGIRLVGDHTSPFGSPDLVLLAPKIPHSWINNEKGTETESTFVKVIQFSHHFNACFAGREDFSDIRELLKKAGCGLWFQVNKNTRSLLNSIHDEFHFRITVHILELLQSLAKSDSFEFLCSPGYVLPKKNTAQKKFGDIHQYILSNFAQDISLQTVADYACMTPSAFSHYFKKRMLTPFTDYIHELRLGNAARLLMETDQAVIRICYESGFNNLSNFNRLFKRKYGVSPLQYRKRAGNI